MQPCQENCCEKRYWWVSDLSGEVLALHVA